MSARGAQYRARRAAASSGVQLAQAREGLQYRLVAQPQGRLERAAAAVVAERTVGVGVPHSRGGARRGERYLVAAVRGGDGLAGALQHAGERVLGQRQQPIGAAARVVAQVVAYPRVDARPRPPLQLIVVDVGFEQVAAQVPQ